MRQLLGVFLITTAILSVISHPHDYIDESICGVADKELFYNQAREAKINEFPWIARIGYNDTRTKTIIYKCGAVLISQRYLVAVGHCLHGSYHDYQNPLTVILGDWDSDNNASERDCDDMQHCTKPVVLEIEEIVIHPFINLQNRENDIALIRLNQSVSYTNNIRAICLPSKAEKNKLFSGELLAIAGWFEKFYAVPKMQKKFVVAHNNLDCQRKLYFNITDAHMCFIKFEDREGYLLSSPLMDVVYGPGRRFYINLVGLLSISLSTGDATTVEVFTRVDYYLEWLQENMV